MNPVSPNRDLDHTAVDGTLAPRPVSDDLPTIGPDASALTPSPDAPASGVDASLAPPSADWGTIGNPAAELSANASNTPEPPPLDLPPELSQLPDFQVVRELGRGGMGVVYQAKQKTLGRMVALKMIIGKADKRATDRFLNEAQAAAALNHPGIVPIFEIGEVGGKPYFTMAFVEGGSLSGLLKSQGGLPAKRAVEIVLQVTQAVAHAHANSIVHRDLKPDNVLLDKQGNARVTDFGLAKQLESDAHLTATGEVLGTPSYMAPEQARGGTKSAGPSVDVYALGGLLYACLVGRAPFSGNTTIEVILKVTIEPPTSPRSIRPDIPPELEAVCMKCLAKEPEERYPSAAALAEDLQAWLNAQTGGSTVMSGIQLTPTRVDVDASTKASVSPGAKTQPLGPVGVATADVSLPRRRSLVPALAVALLVVVVAAGGIFGLTLLKKPNATPAPAPSEVAKAAEGGALDQPIRTDFGLNVEILGSEKSPTGLYYLNEKKNPVFKITSDHDAYVSIFSVDPKGAVTQLFPNEYEKDNHVAAGGALTIPGEKAENYFTMSVSDGDEGLHVIASSKPWDVPKGEAAGPFQVFSSTADKAKWTEARRGIGVRPKETRPDTPAVSEAIVPYRVRKSPRHRGRKPAPAGGPGAGPQPGSRFFVGGQLAS